MKTEFDRHAAFESQMTDFFNLLDQIFNRKKCMLIFLPRVSDMQNPEILVPDGIQYRTR